MPWDVFGGFPAVPKTETAIDHQKTTLGYETECIAVFGCTNQVHAK